MKGIKNLIVLIFLCLLMPLNVQAEEIDEEEIKQKISELAGYEEEEQERSFWFLTAEYEAGEGTGCFVAAFYSSTQETSYDNLPCVYSDVWAVKDDVYTQVFDDIELDGRTTSMELLEMQERNFVLIRTRQSKEYDDSSYGPDRDFLYGFKGTEPVCFLKGMEETVFHSDKGIIAASFESPLGIYEIGRLNVDNPDRTTPYFFKCENGELKEIVGEPCSEEEFYQEISSAVQIKQKVPELSDDEGAIYYYRIPGIGHYINIVSYEQSEYDNQQAIWFVHILHVDKEFENYETTYSGPYGYRYMSWTDRTEEEKQLSSFLKEKIDINISKLIRYEDRAYKTLLVRPGDSLYKIAKLHYGDEAMWKVLYTQNKETIGENPSLIYPGMLLLLE